MTQRALHRLAQFVWDGLWMLGTVSVVSTITTLVLFWMAGTEVHDGTVRLDDGRTLPFVTSAEYQQIIDAHRGHIAGAEFQQGHFADWFPTVVIPVPFLVVAVYVLIRERRALRAWFRPRWGWIATGGACGLAAQAATVVYTRTLPADDLGSKLSELYSQLAVGRDFQIVAVSIIPIVEEIYFRGRAFGLIEASSGVRAAVWVTALVFAAMHAALVPILLPPYLLISLILGWLRAKSGGLMAPIAAHIAFNACAVAAMRLGFGP